MVYIRQPRMSFNAILEGGEWDFSAGNGRPSYDAKYKLVNVPELDGLADRVLETSLALNDGINRFLIAGRRRLSRLPLSEIELPGALKYWPGVTLPFEQNGEYFMDDIRVVLTREGLVFLNENMTNYGPYIEWALDFVEADAGMMFDCPEHEKLFRKISAGYQK